MNYYPFHIGDYLSATRHLSWEEDCAYRRLLDVYYTSEKPLPLDQRAVCRLVLATTESQREAVQIVLDEFFTSTDAGWVNRRADAEIVTMREKQQKQRERAQKRWHKPDATPGTPVAMPRHEEADAAASEIDANAMPPTPTPTPTPTPNIEEKKTAARAAKPRRMLPPDFAPNSAGMKAAAEAGIDVTAELAQFRNHHEAKGTAMADWQAAWRTWVGMAVQFGRGGKRMRTPSSGGWVQAAGFANVHEAHNAGCFEHTAADFRDGKRLEATS